MKDVSFEKFVRMTWKERKSLELFKEDQLNEIEHCLKVFPLVEVKAEAYVRKENDFKEYNVRSGDILTIQLDIVLPLLPKNSVRGYIHST